MQFNNDTKLIMFNISTHYYNKQPTAVQPVYLITEKRLVA